MISITIVILHFVGRYALGVKTGGNFFFVPPLAMGIASLTTLFSLGIYIWGREHNSYILGLTAYLATTATIGTLVLTTGGLWSPFIALWLLLGVFAGLFGWWVFGGLLASANLHTAYEVFLSGRAYPTDQIIQMIVIANAPLLLSLMLWRTESRPEKQGDTKAFKALEQQLSQVANKSEIVINSIADGVVAIDAGGIIQLINPAAQALLGWPKQDAIGLDYRSVIKLVNSQGVAIDENLSPIKQVLASNTSLINNDLQIAAKSGKNILVSLVVSPFGGNVAAGAIVVLRDITREKLDERQKAEFISTASHEMRTPVAAIEGYLGLALNPQTATIDEKAKLYLQKAHESTQHLGRLFQDLLTVAKAEDSRLLTHPVAVDVTAFTGEIVESLAQKAKDKGLFLEFKPSMQDGESNRRISPVYYALVDQDHLREILNNLVDNAIKYTKQGSVSVDITGDSSSVMVNITDTGIGIPPEDITHLFQKFYRVDNTDTREIGGTGLGLYLARRLLEANGGHILVKSAYGKGSIFTVQLPRMSTEQAEAMLQTQQAQPGVAPTITPPPAQTA